MEKILYRNDDYGTGHLNILDVMTFEIYELENTDILDYCLKHYLQGTKLEKTVKNLINAVEDGIYTEDEIYNICKTIIDEINKQTGHNLKYALWLADKETVLDIYTDDFEESSYITAYETSDVILSDLGGDGILFAYDKKPISILE